MLVQKVPTLRSVLIMELRESVREIWILDLVPEISIVIIGQ